MRFFEELTNPAFQEELEKLSHKALPDFNRRQFPSGSFLPWTAEAKRYLDEILQSNIHARNSVPDLLVRLSQLFPKLKICKISSFENVLGEGDFYVGNIQEVERTRHAEFSNIPRERHVLVTAKLSRILKLIQDGSLTVSGGLGGDLRLLYNGTITIGITSLDDTSAASSFIVTKPPDGNIDKRMFVNLQAALLRQKIRQLLKPS